MKTERGKQFLFVRVTTDKGPALIGAYQTDKDSIGAIQIDKMVAGEFHEARSLPHNRKYWAILRCFMHNGGIDRIISRIPQTESWFIGKTEKELHGYLKWVFLEHEVVTNPDGERIEQPSSTAFDRLCQKGFNEYYEMVVDYLEKNLGVEKGGLEKNHSEFM